MEVDIGGATRMWHIVEKIVSKCNLPSLGSINDFFLQDQFTKALEDTDFCERCDLHCVYVVTTKQLKEHMEVPSKYIMMIKATLPKVKNHIEKLKRNITLLKVPLY